MTATKHTPVTPYSAFVDRMRNAPATPLPWAGMNSNSDLAHGIVHEDTGTDVAVFCGRGKWRMNAAYAIHAANAYPQLVAALRDIADSHEILERERGSMRATHTANARTLLRSLGE